MRTILFFDLPSVTKLDKRNYRQFVKVLKMNGFIMLQESVYTHLSLNQHYVDSKIIELKANLPPKGSVMTLSITEKQFSSMNILLGDYKTDFVNSDERTIVI